MSYFARLAAVTVGTTLLVAIGVPAAAEGDTTPTTPGTATRLDPLSFTGGRLLRNHAPRPAAVSTLTATLADTTTFSLFGYPGTSEVYSIGMSLGATPDTPRRITGVFGAGILADAPFYPFALETAVLKTGTGFLYTQLPGGGGGSLQPTDINDEGEVVGTNVAKSGTLEGFLLFGGKLTRLVVPGSTNVYGNGINDAGVVVGAWDDAGGLDHGHGYMWYRGHVTFLPDYSGALETIPVNVNDGGVVVGYVIDQTGEPHSAIYENGRWRTFDPPNSYGSWGYGSNDWGVVVGDFCADSACDTLEGYKYQGGKFTVYAVAGSPETDAEAINDQGAVLGNYIDPANNFTVSFLSH